MKDTVLLWGRGLVAAVIGGVSTAILSLAGGQIFGVDIPYSALGPVAISAAIVNACAYLSQSPLPGEKKP